MANAFGIITPAGRGIKVKGLQDYRPIGAFSFLGRYRVIDFPVSNMSNSDIDRIQVYIGSNPRSLVEHLGTGRYYNINSKSGKLQLLFLEASGLNDIYNTDLEAFEENMSFIERVNKKYVVIAPSYMVYTQDYREMISAHEASGADVTVLYQRVDNAKEAFRNCEVLTLTKDKSVTGIAANDGSKKSANVSLATYVMEKDLFIELVRLGKAMSSAYTLSQTINELLGGAPDGSTLTEGLKVTAYQHKGYCASCLDFKDYFDANMRLLDIKEADSLFKGGPVYTRTTDSCPTKYCEEAKVKRSMVSNGCVIRGRVENSVIGRGVKIGKGAVVKDCIVSAYVTIGDGVHVEGQVIDKWAAVEKAKKVSSTVENPGYISRDDRL